MRAGQSAQKHNIKGIRQKRQDEEERTSGIVLHKNFLKTTQLLSLTGEILYGLTGATSFEEGIPPEVGIMAGTSITTWLRYDLDKDGKDDQITLETPIQQTQADQFSLTAKVTYAKNPKQPKTYPVTMALGSPMSGVWKVTQIEAKDGFLTVSGKTAREQISLSIGCQDLIVEGARILSQSTMPLGEVDAPVAPVSQNDLCAQGITTSDLSQIHLSRLNIGGGYPVADKANPDAYEKEVAKILSEQIPKIYETYKKFECWNGDIKGAIDFNMDIGTDGSVKQSSGYASVVTKNQNITAAFKDILAAWLQEAKFPKGGNVMVAFTISFD